MRESLRESLRESATIWSKVNDLGVTQRDYQRYEKNIFHSFKYIKPIEYNDVQSLNLIILNE